MATNLALDDALIVEAQRIGHHKSKKDAVTAALTEYIQRHRQEEIIGLFGTVDFSSDYDYKAARHGR
jgi:Arc/MetJ family transcription regulator